MDAQCKPPPVVFVKHFVPKKHKASDSPNESDNEQPPNEHYCVDLPFFMNVPFDNKENDEVKDEHQNHKNEEILQFVSVLVNYVLGFFLLLFMVLLHVVVFDRPVHPLFRVHFMANLAFDGS